MRCLTWRNICLRRNVTFCLFHLWSALYKVHLLFKLLWVLKQNLLNIFGCRHIKEDEEMSYKKPKTVLWHKSSFDLFLILNFFVIYEVSRMNSDISVSNCLWTKMFIETYAVFPSDAMYILTNASRLTLSRFVKTMFS